MMITMKLQATWAVLLLVASSTSVSLAADPTKPLATLRKEHPRLLFSLEEQAMVQALAKHDPFLARLIAQNQADAIEMLDQPVVRYEIPDGKRLLSQSRKCISRVCTMAMAYRLAGEERFAEAAIQEMLTAANFKDWNPSHFLDAAEMTTALAIGYDWLYKKLDPQQRATIRAAIIQHGLDPGLAIYQRGGGWTNRDNNWNQVCSGGMLLGALAIAEDEPAMAEKVISFALQSIPHGTKVYQSSGAYPEGPSYWQYGTAYTCLTISALQTALGDDFGIRNTDGLAKTGWYRIHTLGPNWEYFNYADGGTKSRPSSAMFLLARIYDEPTFAWWHRQHLTACLSDKTPPAAEQLDRFFPLEIAWYDPRGEVPSDKELPRDVMFDSRQDFVTMRSTWKDSDALYVGFKAGDNRTNHGHLDIGSFVLEADGVRWAIDLGSDDYNMPGYFGGDRWQYFRLTNHSHNTLVIGGENQNPSAKCDITSFKVDEERTSAIADMTSAYENQAKSVRRGIEVLKRRAVHVRDEIKSASESIRWGMVTAAQIELKDNQAILRQDGKTLLVEILAPADAKFTTASTKPATKREKQNEGTRLLICEVDGRPADAVAISVLVQLASDEDRLVELSPKPLSQW